MSDPNVIAALQSELVPLGQAKDGHATQEKELDTLLQHIGDASFVLLGEATHGTLEFYRLRMRISQRLIAEQGFSAIAVEADWPDALAVNRYVKGERQPHTHQGQHDAAQTALGEFRRFPLWMWRNPEIVQLIAWLHEHNRTLPSERRAGFLAWISTACAARWPRLSTISLTSIPGLPNVRASVMRASIMQSIIRSNTATPPHSACAPTANSRCSISW